MIIFKKDMHQPAKLKQQQGAVLVTTIGLMIVFTVLGIAAMRTNITDISIQSSMMNRANAFQCAEAALRAGEMWLDELGGPAYEATSNPSQASQQVWAANHPSIQNPTMQLDAFWQDDTKTWAYGGGLIDATSAQVGCATDPRFFIESLGSIAPDSLDTESQGKGASAMYRITAYSTGMDENAAVILQSTYLQPIN